MVFDTVEICLYGIYPQSKVVRCMIYDIFEVNVNKLLSMPSILQTFIMHDVDFIT